MRRSTGPDLRSPWFGDGWTLVDVRTEGEFARGTIPGAVNIPVDDLRSRLAEVPEGDVIVHCALGIRGHIAGRVLNAAGHGVRNLDGGYRTWSAGAAVDLERVTA